MGQQKNNRYGWLTVLTLLLCLGLDWFTAPRLGAQEQPPQLTFADPAQYPAEQVPGEGYLPVADWSGRLILPEQAAAATVWDWVWMEVLTSPNADLVGQQVRLQWQDTPANEAFLTLVTRGIEFDEAAIASLEKGTILPTRLDGWPQVGPLQSLAGTRPQDDLIVALPDATFRLIDGESVIEIEEEPIQIPERFYSLVKVLGPDATKPAPELCPGSQPCPSNYLRVQHYNLASQAFDGAIETVRIPQVPPAKTGVFQSTSQDLANSPAGEAGWYLYGAKNTEGIFVARAIAPRRLFQLQPQETLSGTQNGLNYINFGNWRDTPERKGTLQSVLVKSDVEEAQEPTWTEGDSMLVVHLFGGIGSELAEPRSVPGTVNGHFAFGQGQVVQDPFTQPPRLQVIYDQVYSHSPLGIVAGRTLWSEYSGNLQRGWQGTRPISDVIVNIPALNHTYRFGDFTLSPLKELQRELRVMMARYRTGDGTGASIVTPAQSCVQDSNQALYETIQTIRTQVANSPQAQTWLAEHPDDPQTLLFQDLISLGQRLQGQLVPLGIARPDWRENASVLAGTEEEGINGQPNLGNETNLVNNLLSWRTAIPRVGHDNIAAILLQHGGELWFLRTNQVGGADPTILPLAPTELFGDFVVIPVAFSRLIESLTFPDRSGIGIMALGLGAFAFVLFLLRGPGADGIAPLSVKSALGALLIPALWQELVFRVLFLPHPTEGVQPMTVLIWSVISLGLFLAYRGFRARLLHLTGHRSRYLFLSLVLGILATGLYLLTGSLWTVLGLHWGSWMMERVKGVGFKVKGQVGG
ncbi:type II CAAX prenyl endopeptidase Rce1 family protein [Halomicronema sp. CCY15110]|uniref:CPBP family glutamic-type intramembrane protease n=1 Tax=Halomicronema sp. CCY15110 TaxID=2767773 RepID=UPI0019506D19|nr:CPBP family glutamic-type intramembrane protease [Halomicronema sp. CCY15110]